VLGIETSLISNGAVKIKHKGGESVHCAIIIIYARMYLPLIAQHEMSTLSTNNEARSNERRR
jgi:hypothetical protein